MDCQRVENGLMNRKFLSIISSNRKDRMIVLSSSIL